MRYRTFLRLAATAGLAACYTATAPEIETTTFAGSLNISLSTMTKTASGLYYKDLVVGSGALVANGQAISVHYVGNLANGTRFDANSAGMTPFKFLLGSGQVIPGFDQGVSGMRVGGQRQIIIPPTLGYGGDAVGNVPPNSILVFTIEVVSNQ